MTMLPQSDGKLGRAPTTVAPAPVCRTVWCRCTVLNASHICATTLGVGHMYHAGVVSVGTDMSLRRLAASLLQVVRWYPSTWQSGSSPGVREAGGATHYQQQHWQHQLLLPRIDLGQRVAPVRHLGPARCRRGRGRQHGGRGRRLARQRQGGVGRDRRQHSQRHVSSVTRCQLPGRPCCRQML